MESTREAVTQRFPGIALPKQYCRKNHAALIAARKGRNECRFGEDLHVFFQRYPLPCATPCSPFV